MANLYRKILQNFRVSESERNLISEKMAAAGIRNREAYLRKMSLGGYVLRLDLSAVQEMTRLLANATGSMNQIAKRVNADGSIYESDVKDLQAHYNSLWGQVDKILLSLAKIQK